MDRTINQIRRLCVPSTQSLSSVKNFDATYSSINSLKIKQDDNALDELPDDADAITDDDEENLKCERNLNADNCRLCKAKAAHSAVLEKNDASPVRKTLPVTEAPHFDTNL